MNEIEIASTLESEFVRRKRDHNPNYHVPPFGDTFPKLAAQCIKHNLEPSDFITAQFRDMDPSHVTTKSFFTAKAINKCIIHTCDRKVPEKEKFKYGVTYLRSQIVNVSRSVEKVLMDDSLDFPAWFRVVITKEPIKEVMTKYLHIAKSEFNGEIKQVCMENNLDWKRINGN